MGADRLRPLALALALVLTGCGGGAGGTTAGATVDSVRDGDTVLLEDGRRVRLVQLDAPELRIECHGDAAAAELERLLPAGSRIRLERDPRLDDRDQHGRLLRYVHAGGRNVNLALVRAGAAAPFFYRGVRGRYATALLEAALQARAERRGLWRTCPATRLDPGRAVATGPP